MEPLVDVRPGIVGVAVRRRWRTLVVSLLIGGLAAIALLVARGPTYTATAVVLLKPLPGNPYSPTAAPGRAEELTSLETEAALVGGQPVADKAISASGGRLGPQAADQVSVAVPSNSKILRISFAAKNPDAARLGAQAFADAYLAYRHDQAERSASAQIDQLNRQIEASQSAQNAASKKLANEPDGSASIPVLQQQVQTYASEIAQLRIQLAGLEDASNAPGDVITPARQPSQADGLPAWLITAGVVLIAAGIGLLVALWREYSDDRIRDADDIAALGGGRLVATVAPASVETLLDEPVVTEGYRLLRSATVAHLGDSSAVVTIAPVGSSVDAAGIASGLAAALERTGRRIILVITDADPTQPYQWWTNGRGLSDLLRRPDHVRDQLALALHEVKPGLQVIGPGRHAAEMIDRYQSADMVAILDQLRATADIVVVATPPLTTATGKALADLADLMFFAVALEQNRHTELVGAAEEMTLHRVKVLGTLAVTPRKKHWGRRWFVRSRKRQPPVARPLPASPGPPPVRTVTATPPSTPDRGGDAEPPTIPIASAQPDGAKGTGRNDKAAGGSARKRTRRQSPQTGPTAEGSDRVSALIRDYSARSEEKS